MLRVRRYRACFALQGPWSGALAAMQLAAVSTSDGPFHLSPVVFNGDTDEGHDGDRAVALGSATKL